MREPLNNVGRLLAVTLTTVVVAGACSGTGDPAVRRSPEASAAQVAALLLLDSSRETCLVAAYTADGEAAAVLDADASAPLGADAATASTRAVRSCADDDTLVASLTRLTVAAAGVDASGPASSCLEERIAALPAPDIDVLVISAVNPAALDNASLGRLADLTDRLAVDCAVDLVAGRSGDDLVVPAESSVPPAGPTVDVGDGATQATR